MKHTILVVDDHTLIRETWTFILNTHPLFQVVGECASGEEAIRRTSELKPAVVVMDINLPGMSGLEATEELQRVTPESKVLAVSLHSQPSYARKMMQAGAVGYVTKNSSREEMFLAIETILRGNRYVCNEIKDILTEQLFETTSPVKDWEALSKREREIVALLKKGFSSREIGEQLAIASKTVEVHRCNILRKLNLRNTAALVQFLNTHLPELAN
jgi:two-component system invasion response regulator UvrY